MITEPNELATNMSLRERFAMAIIQGLLANPNVVGHDAQYGWSLVNASEVSLCNYAANMAEALIDSLNSERSNEQA